MSETPGLTRAIGPGGFSAQQGFRKAHAKVTVFA
jgi:hypothetical protein